MQERIIELLDTLDLATFYGVNNENMLCLKSVFPKVRIVARGTQIKVSGSENDIDEIEKTIIAAQDFLHHHGTLTSKQLEQIIGGTKPVAEIHTNLILHGVNGKPITARTENQRLFASRYEKDDLLFAIGPAGSGKTYTAIALAVKALKNKQVRKIILSRPAVEAGEKLGFLPGDMREKIDPYLQPLYDALEDMIPAQKLQEYIERGTIQIAPLAFMRGRTLNDAVIILDEAQNTTTAQIKMFLTRLGFGGKMIVTGDLTQIDLPQSQKSGLRDAIDKLSGVEGISIINFNQNDIVRHPLVSKIISAYETH